MSPSNKKEEPAGKDEKPAKAKSARGKASTSQGPKGSKSSSAGKKSAGEGTSRRRLPAKDKGSHKIAVMKIGEARITALSFLALKGIPASLLALLLSVIPLIGTLLLVWTLVAAGLAVRSFFLMSNTKLKDTPFLKDAAFFWVDPFVGRPGDGTLLWFKAAGRGPLQLLAWAFMFAKIQQSAGTEIEPASAVLEEISGAGTFEIPRDLEPESDKARGLRLLVLLKLVRFSTEDDLLTASLTLSGQASFATAALGNHHGKQHTTGSAKSDWQ